MKKKLLYLNIFFLLSSNAYGNQRLDQHGGSWNKIKLKGTIPQTKRLRYWIEPNIRLIFTKQVFLESVNRFALGYHLADHVTIWQGYTANPFRTKKGKLGFEQRIWQQLYLGFYPKDFFHFSSRTRIEYRWQNLIAGIAWRIRQRFLFKVHDTNKKIAPVIFDEIFFNATRPAWVGDSILNQNRAFIGFDVYLDQDNFLRIGYVNRYTTERTRNLMLHLLWLALHVKIH